MLQSELDAAKGVLIQKIDATGYRNIIERAIGPLNVLADNWAYDMLDAAEKVRRARDAVERAPVPAGIIIIPDAKG